MASDALAAGGGPVRAGGPPAGASPADGHGSSAAAAPSLFGGNAFWWIAGAGTALACGSFLVLMFVVKFDLPEDQPQLDALKLVFQFALITVGGALVLAYLNSRRDREERLAKEQAARRERGAARCAALQELLIALGDAHRRLKVVKRQMRSQIQRAQDRAEDGVAPPYSIRADAFERAMDALLNAQIAAEEVRDLIAIRTDLLKEDQIARIRRALRYGARYFHDVYQDYEHCRVDRTDDHYIVTPGCRNLSNFLLAKRPPPDLPAAQAQELDEQFTMMKNDDRPLADRHDALERIEKLRQSDPARRRYRAVATECFALAADEVRQSLSCEARFRA